MEPPLRYPAVAPAAPSEGCARAAFSAPATDPTLEIAIVDGDASDFAAFAYSRRRNMLAAVPEKWVALGARWRGAPVGLALAKVQPQSAWLESVMVAAPLRRKGIGTALLSALAGNARGAGATQIRAQYSGFLPCRAALESLLAGSGWDDPKLIDIQLVGLAGEMADGGGAWGPVRRTMADMGDYSVGPFALRDPDHAAIDALLASAPELGVPDPRACTALDLDVCVVLRHREELIGWIVGERLTHSHGHGTLVPDATSILYTSARLADGHRRTVMLAGYYRAFSRQAEIHGPQSRAVYRTHPAAKAMYAFTRSRFAPMALHIEERFGSSLTIDQDQASTSPQEFAAC